MSWGAGIKRDSLDADTSFAVRERAEWCCERCGAYFPVGERHRLTCSHYIGRRNKATRYYPDNVFSLCIACHGQFSDNPMQHTEWVMERLGHDRFSALRSQSWSAFKMTKDVRQFIAKKLRASVKEMQRLREMGILGRLSFESPYPGPNDILEPAAKRPKKAKKKAGPKKRIQSRPLTDPNFKQTLRRGVVPRKDAA